MNFKIIAFNILIFLFSGKNCLCQELSIGGTAIYTHTNQRVKMKNSKEDFENTDYSYTFSYEHFIKNSRISVFASTTKFDGFTMIKFEEGTVIDVDGFSVVGDGFSGVKIRKYDLGVTYNLIKNYRRFYLKPFGGVGLQLSKIKDVDIFTYLFTANGPDYFQISPITVDKFKTSQFVPFLGFKTGFVFWKRLDIGFIFQGVYGFKSYQDMFFTYSYRGEPQETAVFEATGTGLFCTFNIGFRIFKQE